MGMGYFLVPIYSTFCASSVVFFRIPVPEDAFDCQENDHITKILDAIPLSSRGHATSLGRLGFAICQCRPWFSHRRSLAWRGTSWQKSFIRAAHIEFFLPRPGRSRVVRTAPAACH